MSTLTQPQSHVTIPAGRHVVTDETAHVLRRGQSITIQTSDGDYTVTGWVIGLFRGQDGVEVRILTENDRLERRVPLPATVCAHA